MRSLGTSVASISTAGEVTLRASTAKRSLKKSAGEVTTTHKISPTGRSLSKHIPSRGSLSHLTYAALEVTLKTFNAEVTLKIKL